MKKILAAAAAIAGAAILAIGMAGCNNNNKIYVDTNAFFAPFEYIDASGNIVGVDVDIMNKVGEKLGKEVEFVNTEFNVIIDNVSSGKKYDCGAAGITITPERQKQVDFSKPYYTAVQYVIFKTGELEVTGTSTDGKNKEYILWSQLQGKKIAVQQDTTGDLTVDYEMGTDKDENGETTYGALCNPETGKEYEGTELVKLSSAPVAISALGTTADVVVIDELPAQYLASKNEGLECYALYYDEATATEEQYAICVTKGNNELLDAINAVLDELGENGVKALVSKHFGVQG